MRCGYLQSWTVLRMMVSTEWIECTRDLCVCSTIFSMHNATIESGY